MNLKTLIIILLAALIAAGGFYLGQKYKIAPQNAETGIVVSSPTPAPATDTNTFVDTATSASGLTPIPTLDDKEAVTAMVKASEVARIGAEANSSDYAVTQLQGNYAKGSAGGSGGGALWFAEKVGGSWKLVFIGNGIIQCSDLTSFPDFPTTMIPECWDKATDKLIKR
jgi:hypothetical protein